MDWWTLLKHCFLVVEIIIISSPLSQMCPTKCACNGLSVECDNSQMGHVPLGIPINTTYLSFRNNSLTIIEKGTQLHNLPNLKTLLLNENKLTTIEEGSFWGHGNLKYLDLSFNDLRNLDKRTFQELRGLTDLFLHNNPKLCLDFGSLGVLPELTTLVLGKTAVKFIPGLFEISVGNLIPPLGLLKLQLWNMGLEEVPYEAIKELPNLSSLNLKQNQIKCLSHSAFINNKNLTVLDLSSNPIMVVTSDTFKGLGKLVQLLLDDTNTLTLLPQGVFDPLPTSVQVCLYGNRWNCDCHMKWLKLWMEDEVRVHCAQKPNCYSPSDLQSNPFFSIPEEKFQCDGSISKQPTVACQTRIQYKEGYCLELSSPTTETISMETTTTIITPATSDTSKINNRNLAAIVSGICIVLVLVAIVGGFLARQIRIQKKIRDQNKYFNISYENGDQQLQMDESPTPEKEKSFNWGKGQRNQ